MTAPPEDAAQENTTRAGARVDVLVINWNGQEHLEACFDSLLAQDYPNARFILVDNASDDGSVEWFLRRHGDDPRTGVVECPRNLGWSGGNNHAMRQSLENGADYILLLNNDAAAAPGAISALVEKGEARRDLGALAPRIVLFDTPEVLNSVGLTCSYIGAAWDTGVGRADGPRWQREQGVLGGCGAALFLRAAVLRETGLLPEDFEIFLDDLDLCLRIYNAGHAIETCPSAVVRHKFSATMGEGPRARRKYYLNTRNRYLLIMRNFPWFPFFVAAALLGDLRAIGRSLVEGEAWRVGAHVRAWAAALAHLPKALASRCTGPSRFGRPCRFWRFIRWDRMYCPPVLLPEHGWYPPVEHQGRLYHPMAPRAERQAPPGHLRVFLANCYPACGTVTVRVEQNGRPLAELDGSRGEAVIEPESGAEGPLVFVAGGVLSAEDTGECFDCGGWIAMEPEADAARPRETPL